MNKLKYEDLLELATNDGNELVVFENGTGLITGAAYVQGIWVSNAIIKYWREEGLLS
jgi:hypothetical protein